MGDGLRVLLPAAILLGLAAAVLLAPAPGTSGVALLPYVQVPAAPSWLGPALVLGIVLVFVAFGLARRLAGYQSANGPVVVGLLVCGGVAVVLDIIFRLLHPEAVGSSPGAPVQNGTVNQTCNPSLCPPGGGGGLGGNPVAPWYEGATLYVLIVAVVVVAALLYPRIDAYLAPRRSAPAASRETPRELEEALRSLGEPALGDDARRRIIRAYGELLSKVAAPLEGVAPSTPREIAREVVRRFGVRPATAATITELFEEARYSVELPMGEADVVRAEAALRQAIEESSGPGATAP